MAISIQNIIDRASEIALNLGSNSIPPSEATIELLLPHVIANVLGKGNLSREKLYSLRQTYELEFVDNQAFTPTLAMPEYFDSAVLRDEARTRNLSFVASNYDFNLPLPSVFDYWCIQDDVVIVKLQDADPFSGTLLFECVSQPEIPTSPTAPIAITADLADDFVMELVRAIRGEAPYGSLGAKDEKED